VHSSHLADRFVKDPNEIVHVNQKVEVTVLEVDIPRKRIGLSMKSDPFRAKKMKRSSKPVKKEEPQGTMAEKLAMLKGKFR
nr:RNA-binding transcriptional accessory protein [Algoriphagus sp.]